jgi:aspartyl-tRNA(Asn)/glutamyl-tRNA(Gln) amidotransferase subunit C
LSISPEVVEHVARLSHVGLQPGEIAHLTDELASVLDHIALLQQVDTDGVEPTAFAVAIDTVLRDDETSECWPPSSVLANAPHRRDDLFEVQAVFD